MLLPNLLKVFVRYYVNGSIYMEILGRIEGLYLYICKHKNYEYYEMINYKNSRKHGICKCLRKNKLCKNSGYTELYENGERQWIKYENNIISMTEDYYPYGEREQDLCDEILLNIILFGR